MVPKKTNQTKKNKKKTKGTSCHLKKSTQSEKNKLK